MSGGEPAGNETAQYEPGGSPRKLEAELRGGDVESRSGYQRLAAQEGIKCTRRESCAQCVAPESTRLQQLRVCSQLLQEGLGPVAVGFAKIEPAKHKYRHSKGQEGPKICPPTEQLIQNSSKYRPQHWSDSPRHGDVAHEAGSLPCAG